MAEFKNSDEVRREIYDSMPEAVADVYLPLSLELQNLSLEWRWFNELYGEEGKTLDILTGSAASFFGHLQGIQISNIVLRISKLLDRAKSNTRERRPNASIDYMLIALGEVGEEDLRNRLNQQKGRLKTSAKSIEAYRNRVTAHIDLATAVGREPVPRLAKTEFESVLKGLGSVLNEISQRFQGSSVAYEYVAENGGAKNLIFVLSQGIEHRNCRLRELDELRKRAERDKKT